MAQSNFQHFLTISSHQSFSHQENSALALSSVINWLPQDAVELEVRHGSFSKLPTYLFSLLDCLSFHDHFQRPSRQPISRA
jgi:hypothetical protein